MDQAALRQKAQEYISLEKHEGFRREVEDLLAEENFEELHERFYTELSFGTGGIRGVMGGGYNRMNPLMVQKATQGLARYVVEKGEVDAAGRKSVAIAYDSRHNSPLFARTAASVLAAHGLHVYLFSALRPTPTLSFAVRYLGATSGIVCTASHNPKQYNGYKVYWADGAQIVTPHDQGIISNVRRVGADIKSMDYDAALAQGLIELIDEKVDAAYLKMVQEQVIRPELMKSKGKNVKVVFTPLHGTGAYLVERALDLYGVPVMTVPEQREPDGDFPTVSFPNPEEASALKMALDLAKKNQADLVIGTDPDADRVGIAVKEGNDFTLLTGNQHGVLLADYIFSGRKAQGTLPADSAFVNTIVTTDLQRRVAAKYGAKVYETLTGFKWIASKIREFEQHGGPSYIFGCEESYGFMIGDQVRDKDSVTATILTIEMTLFHKDQGKSLLDRLEEIYKEFGYYQETLVARYFEGSNGTGIMNKLMEGLRNNPAKEIAGIPVISMRDIEDGTTLDIASGSRQKNIDLPSSNVLQWLLKDGSVISARPSGTEPKIKFYASVAEEPGQALSAAKKKVGVKIDGIEAFINAQIAKVEE